MLSKLSVYLNISHFPDDRWIKDAVCVCVCVLAQNVLNAVIIQVSDGLSLFHHLI